MNIAGKVSKFLYESVIDFDLSSLYPSIILSLNISPETCIGKIKIDNEIGNEEQFLNDFTSGDIINFGKKWLNLPGINDILNEINNI